MASNYKIIQEAIALVESMNPHLVEEESRKKLLKKLSKQLEQDLLGDLKSKFKKHLKDIGKKETITIDRIIAMNEKKKMPTMIKHCVVAVAPKLKGEDAFTRFIGAHNICFWSFKRYRLLDASFKPTARGKLREKYHKNQIKENPDPDAKKKTSDYNKQYKKIFGFK